MKTDKIENTCENCKYFVRHYAKINGEYLKVGCGHCSNNILSPAKRKKCPYAVKCRSWVSAANTPQ